MYEDLKAEAEKIAGTLKQVYQIDSELISESLEGFLPRIPEFNGYYPGSYELLNSSPKNKFVLIITGRDLFADNKSRDDDWVLGVVLKMLQLPRLQE